MIYKYCGDGAEGRSEEQDEGTEEEDEKERDSLDSSLRHVL